MGTPDNVPVEVDVARERSQEVEEEEAGGFHTNNKAGGQSALGLADTPHRCSAVVVSGKVGAGVGKTEFGVGVGVGRDKATMSTYGDVGVVRDKGVTGRTPVGVGRVLMATKLPAPVRC